MSRLSSLFNKYKAVVVFDTETTGFNPYKDQIIELAAVRIELNDAGLPYISDSIDTFVLLPDGQTIPEKIVEITHITDDQLRAEGVPMATAAGVFKGMIRGKTLLVAHNAQFDLGFIEATFKKVWQDSRVLDACDYLDSLTVYKDRRAYPHKLADAIEAYGLQDKVKNSHRAIDDVAALFEVLMAMDEERDDLADYINIFGYNPKYGVSGKEIKKVTYHAQRYWDDMRTPDWILPAIVRRERDNG